jgi:hypothetical protein
VKAPGFLYVAHAKLVERMFDERGFHRRHRVALALVRWTIDRFWVGQCMGVTRETSTKGSVR